MEFVLHDALGPNWELDMDVEMAEVCQREREKIEQFAEKLGLYLDTLKIERDSR